MHAKAILASLLIAVTTALPTVELYDKDNCNNGAVVIGTYALKATAACQDIPAGERALGGIIRGAAGSLPAGCSFRFYTTKCAQGPSQNFWPLTSEGQYNQCFAAVHGQPIQSVQAFGTCAV